jgi:hypothetical protein
VSATILKFTGTYREPPQPCPVHPEGKKWQHGERAPDGTRYCRAGDYFCRCDEAHKSLCDYDLRQRADGTPLEHGDVVPAGKYCGYHRRVCQCREQLSCARVMKPKKQKGKKQ